jgi:hypothetical protein
MRKLKFDLDVQTNALLCPNPQDFYSKAYITENIVDNFRAVPGVKESTKLAKQTFDNVIKAAGCSWASTDGILDAVDITVCKVDAMTQICQYDLESSFVSLGMAKGDSNWEVTSFMNHYWNELSMEVEAEIQDIRWNGDTGLTSSYLKECDGYIVKLEDGTAVGLTAGQITGVTTSTITQNNIIFILTGLVKALPEAVKGKKRNVRIYMSATNALLYELATLGLNTNFNYTGELALYFAGYKIAPQEDMNNNFIVIGLKDDFVYAFDGEGDSKNLKAVNLSDTTAEPVIRTRVAMKIGFHVLNDTNIVYYKA